jgi:UDP-N-acetylglucosamine 4,6-dehydratase/5-epimerase
MNIIKEMYNSSFYDNKNIMITGGTGTLGNILTDFFLNLTNINKLCIYSRDEFKQHNIKIKYKNHENYGKLRFFIGDIRDLERTKYAMKEIDIVFHAAALKQVDAIEYNPMEAIKTNILGTQNVIMACIENNVDQLIGISTDKCVAPVNLYGATKLCLEKLVITAYEYSGFRLKTCVLRYGNVVGSRGSVVPIFKKQNENGEFTVTDKRMTRFTLTIEEASKFILNCVSISKGGEIFVPKLPKYTLPQLCKIINPNNEIKEIGIRPGEKLHEEMISEAESLNVWESEYFYIVESTSHQKFRVDKELIDKFKMTKIQEIFGYSSENAELISEEELRKQIEYGEN